MKMFETKMTCNRTLVIIITFEPVLISNIACIQKNYKSEIIIDYTIVVGCTICYLFY